MFTANPNFRLVPTSAVMALVLAAALAVTPAAAAPSSPIIPVQGVLRTPEGGPVADGAYTLTFRIYAGEKDEAPLYKEVHVALAIVAGGFTTLLGGQDLNAPIPAALFAEHDSAWLGVQVQNDPELERTPFHTVPYAARAHVADALSGPLDGSQIKVASLPDSALAFGYAASASKGGPANALACTGCVTIDHIAEGVLDAKHVAFQHGGQQTSVQASLGALVAALQVDGSAVGIGKAPGAICALDIGSDGGSSCVDGAPALLTRIASSDAEMGKLGPDGLLVYRKDSGKAYLRVQNKWRRVLLEAECGDGVVDVPEQCDDGDANADTADKCRTTCTNPACGDLIVDAAEQCDDGNAAVTDACILCKKAACGDGFVLAGVEACDDGNALSTDACVAGCKTAICGDGFIFAGVEACDDGDANADTPNKCRKNCKLPACGDGITDNSETCDDGNGVANDECSNACKSNCPAKCANGSCTDCNQAGQTLIGSSAFVDASPPAGWTQCFGFVNTAGNDVGNQAADGCLGAGKLRLRVWDAAGALVVDVYSNSTQNMGGGWPAGGSYITGSITLAKCASPWWPCGNGAGLYGSTGGTCSGGHGGYPSGGMCFSNGNCGQLSIALAGGGGDEIANGNCSGNTQWVGYRSALYR